MLIEDRHFLRNKITPYELGFKSLAVNLSDVAAMGGKPHSAFLSFGLPADINVEWVDEFFKGFKYLCTKTNTMLLGGDTTGSPDKIVINVAVIGFSKIRNLKKRSTAKPGDIICVTGCTGDSGAGFKILKENLPEDSYAKYLIHKHHLPLPMINEGQWLSNQKGVNAMIDISDGIESDIKRIMEKSGVGAEIYLDKIPISNPLKITAKKFNWNPIELAVSGGEDYCLMVTIHKNEFIRIRNNYFSQFNNPLYPIGIVTLDSHLNFKIDGSNVELAKHGYDHFLTV